MCIRDRSVCYVCAGDRDFVDRLAAGLQRLGHEVWLDKRLSVGQEWWAEILNQIRLSEAIVVALSPGLLESPTSAAECGYAVQLGKVLLPVCLRPVRNEFLPPDLAPLQIVDYCTPAPEAAFELADALAHLPASPALPDPQTEAASHPRLVYERTVGPSARPEPHPRPTVGRHGEVGSSPGEANRTRCGPRAPAESSEQGRPLPHAGCADRDRARRAERPTRETSWARAGKRQCRCRCRQRKCGASKLVRRPVSPASAALVRQGMDRLGLRRIQSRQGSDTALGSGVLSVRGAWLFR